MPNNFAFNSYNKATKDYLDKYIASALYEAITTQGLKGPINGNYAASVVFTSLSRNEVVKADNALMVYDMPIELIESIVVRYSESLVKLGYCTTTIKIPQGVQLIVTFAV